MVHEPEGQAQGGEDTLAEVRASFLAISLMRLNLALGWRTIRAEVIMR